jgi:hypothetical protein
MAYRALVQMLQMKGKAMQWSNDREKQIGSELGFILLGNKGRGGREAQLVNLVFDAKDTEFKNPRQGNVRPASMAEVKMWRMLISANPSG